METGTNNNLRRGQSFSLGELSRLLDAEVKGDPDLRVTGIGPLDSATSGQLSFLVDSKYRHLVSGCRASALIVSSEFRELEFNLLITRNPYLAFAKAAQLFQPDSAEAAVIHPTAFIGEGVLLGEGVPVGPIAHIGDNSQIGPGTKIGAGAYLGKGVRIGERCLIHPRACILDGCVIGNRVIIHAGAVIGADGYGYAHDQQGRHVKIPQVGIVQIDDDVEIGANTTVDRATFGRTWIKRGAKIDNLVMIAHNCVVGEDSLLVAQVGISGSTRIGNQVILGGKVGAVGHVQVGDGVKVSANSGIRHSLKPNQNYSGDPAVPHDEWLRIYACIRRLPKLREALKRLDERVHSLEEAMEKDDGHN
jgi:UDP-3-O-[3-hydroxymyristoyl] glucosamine N-acyltransferase